MGWRLFAWDGSYASKDRIGTESGPKLFISNDKARTTKEPEAVLAKWIAGHAPQSEGANARIESTSSRYGFSTVVSYRAVRSGSGLLWSKVG